MSDQTNKERQARYRERCKRELEELRALRNGNPESEPAKGRTSRNGDEVRELRGANMQLQLQVDKLKHDLEALRNKPQQDNQELRPSKQLQEALRNENGKLKTRIKKQAERIDALRNARAELLPDEIKAAQTQLKRERTRLQNDRRALDARISTSKVLNKDEVRIIQNVLHPDRAPVDMKDKATKAFQAFQRIVQ